ncbi:MAG TPA: hypothetical protein VJW75_03205, partial [Candidatus Eisenbacteria bacterium]|nr:hypothetical protein [Candidatus Eisenbacteria bacterium]
AAKIDSVPAPGWSDGEYEIRLVVTNALGVSGTATSRFVLDNASPFVAQTAPETIYSRTGGDVYSTHAEVRVYFPPGMFNSDARVDIRSASVPPADSIAPGVRALSEGWDIAWTAETDPKKTGVLDMEFDLSAASGVSRAIYYLDPAAGWKPLGGSPAAAAGRLQIPLAAEGTYAVFTQPEALVTGAGLSKLSFSPRVFSPTRGSPRSDLSIAFSLGRGAPVRAVVYNLAGRPVRKILDGVPLSGGANVVRWDGRDTAGAIVNDGMYIVTIEALGQRQSRTVAVTR